MVSTKVMLANATSINACQGLGTGSGASAATSTSGLPNSVNHTAFIAVTTLRFVLRGPRQVFQRGVSVAA
jgi:hypothetical protein